MGNQAIGPFGTTNGELPAHVEQPMCCDAFDANGESARGLSTVCCFFPAVGHACFLAALD